MKKLILAVLCLILALSLCSCSLLSRDGYDEVLDKTIDESDLEPHEAAAEKLEADTTYYNSYLGIEFMVPKNWWNYEVNDVNFTTSATAKVDSVNLDIYMEDDYSSMALINFANLRSSTLYNHIGVSIYAEKDDRVETLENFAMVTKEYWNSDFDDVKYEFIEESSKDLGGIKFYEIIYNIASEGYDDCFMVLLMAEVNDGYFIVFEATYWPENKTALDKIHELISDNFKKSNSPTV